jgi:hypothetical protein
MRRTIFLALLATLLCAPVARADTTTQIWRDCVLDSKLDGHYTLAQLREARSHPPADGLEYTDCTDILARAIAAKTSSHSSGNNSGGNSSGGGTVGGGGGTGGGSSSGGGGSGGGGTGDSAPAAPLTPSTPADQKALSEAAIHGVQCRQDRRQAGHAGRQSQLAADVGRNSLPDTLVIVLILLGLAAILGGGRQIRDRVVAHRHP